MEDPAQAPEADWETAFAQTYDTLERRALAFLDMNFETMEQGELKATLDRIGQQY